MRKVIYTVLSLFLTALFAIQCNTSGPAVTTPTHHTNTTHTQTATHFTYHAGFYTSNSAYSDLLRACNRCGRKWILPHTGGLGRPYRKCSWLSRNSELRCENWGSAGHIQIQFAEKKLPTQAKVTIQPKFSGHQERWGHSFTAKGTARAINENEGFSIELSSVGGLGGNKVLHIESTRTNHVNEEHLSDVEAHYGNGSEAEILFSVDLLSRQKTVLKPSQYSCADRPPLNPGPTSLCIGIN